MYSITRNDAADMLWVSTRSLDRYVKSGKIRAKKVWKIVYINSEDVDTMLWKNNQSHKVIIPKEEAYWSKQVSQKENTSGSGIVKKYDYEKLTASFEKVFLWLREEINKKDEKIQELSVELWKSQEVLKNSISILEHKKSQFLIEESKIHLTNEISDMKSTNSKLDEELKYEKFTNKLLIAFVIILLSVTAIIWFVKI